MAVRPYALVLAMLALASCATAAIVTPAMHTQASGAGKTACLVRGLGGPITSYVEAGRSALEALGFRVAVYDMLVSPDTLQPCAVIVAHSAGALSTLATTGPRLIFVIDGFATAMQHCPAEATCMNFYNPGDVLGLTLEGARNINCFIDCGALDAVPLLGHMTMPASAEVWRTIVQQVVAQARVTEAHND